MKDSLVFDTTDVNTIADSDSVGAYVRSSDGTLIDHAAINSVNRLAVDSTLKDGAGTPLTSTLVGSDQALDVNLVNTIPVDLDGIYDGVNNADPDNVGIIAHTRAASIGDAQQSERTTAGAVGSIVAASLSDVNALDMNAFAYALNPSGDARLLTMDASDNLNVNITNASLAVEDIADTAIVSAAKTLTTSGTAETVVSAALADRRFLFIYNKDNRVMYLGGSTVSSSNGFPLSPRSYLELRAGPNLGIYFDSPKSGHEIRTLELS